MSKRAELGNDLDREIAVRTCSFMSDQMELRGGGGKEAFRAIAIRVLGLGEGDSCTGFWGALLGKHDCTYKFVGTLACSNSIVLASLL